MLPLQVEEAISGILSLQKKVNIFNNCKDRIGEIVLIRLEDIKRGHHIRASYWAA